MTRHCIVGAEGEVAVKAFNSVHRFVVEIDMNTKLREFANFEWTKKTVEQIAGYIFYSETALGARAV